MIVYTVYGLDEYKWAGIEWREPTLASSTTSEVEMDPKGTSRTTSSPGLLQCQDMSCQTRNLSIAMENAEVGAKYLWLCLCIIHVEGQFNCNIGQKKIFDKYLRKKVGNLKGKI